MPPPRIDYHLLLQLCGMTFKKANYRQTKVLPLALLASVAVVALAVASAVELDRLVTVQYIHYLQALHCPLLI